MPASRNDPRLERLLQQPALWRGRHAAQQATWPTGFDALDGALPGGGWPCTGLVEILVPQPGLGEFRLWTPLLARLTSAPAPRWCVFVAAPFEPCAPAFAARGIDLARLLFVASVQPLWALEQSLLSGACDLAFGWLRHAAFQDLRRLVLATAEGRAPVVLFRPAECGREPSPATLRLLVEASPDCLSLRLLKSRGGSRERIELVLPA